MDADNVMQFLREFGFPSALLAVVLFRIDYYARTIIEDINQKLERTAKNERAFYGKILDAEKKIETIENGLVDIKRQLRIANRHKDEE